MSNIGKSEAGMGKSFAALDESEPPEIIWPDESLAVPVIGEDLQYILDLYEDGEISLAELKHQAASVGYSAEEIAAILGAE